MKDSEIVDLYWSRDESAIAESSQKYGKSLENTSYSITRSREDAKECVQDTYLSAWNSMPTDRPEFLGAYLMKIVRNLSINIYRKNQAQKRHLENTPLIFDELAECIPQSPGDSIFEEMEAGRLTRVLNSFLEKLDQEKRIIFVRRYFYSDSVNDIAEKLGLSVSNVKTTLYRTRQKLAEIIRREGFYED